MIKHNAKLYIIGPIAGKEDGNRQAFMNAAGHLNSLGYYPINPHMIGTRSCFSYACQPSGRKVVEDGHTEACHLRHDLQHLLGADGVYVLLGWEASAGGRTELTIAAQCGLELYFQSYKEPPLAQ